MVTAIESAPSPPAPGASRSIAVRADVDRAVRQGTARCRAARQSPLRLENRSTSRRTTACCPPLCRRLHPQPVARRQRPGPRRGIRAAQQQQRQHAGPEYASRHGSSSLPGATGHCRHPHCIMPGSTTCGRLWPFRRTVPPTSPAATFKRRLPTAAGRQGGLGDRRRKAGPRGRSSLPWRQARCLLTQGPAGRPFRGERPHDAAQRTGAAPGRGSHCWRRSVGRRS